MHSGNRQRAELMSNNCRPIHKKRVLSWKRQSNTFCSQEKVGCAEANILPEKTFHGCCGFFGLFGRVLKVVLPDVSPVSVASIFRELESEFCPCSVAVCWIVFIAVGMAFVS